MRKLVLPIAGIISCMLVISVVVWELAKPKRDVAARELQPAPSPIQFQPPPTLSPPRTLSPPPTTGRVQPATYQPPPTQRTQQIQRTTYEAPSAAEQVIPQTLGAPGVVGPPQAAVPSPPIVALPPRSFPAPVAQPKAMQPSWDQRPMLGQPGIEYAEGASQDLGQFEGQAAPYSLKSNIQANYDNTIGPDEDLLQGAGITPPATSTPPASSTPTAPYEPATPVRQSFEPLTPRKSLSLQTGEPANSGSLSGEDLLDQLPSENRPSQQPPLTLSDESPVRLPEPAPPASSPVDTPPVDARPVDTPPLPDTPTRLPNVESTQPTTPPADLAPANPTPSVPAQRPAAPANSGGWSADTPPGPDEDLLNGQVDDLPSPGNSQPPAQNDTPLTAPPVDPETAPSDSTTEQTTKPPVKSPFTTSPNTQRPSPKGPAGSGLAPHSVKSNPPPGGSSDPDVDPHLELYAEDCFPSATKCKVCHEQIYEEWAGSSHAYASISPMFQKFEQTIHGLTMGTISHFCMRCHAPVATALAHPREKSVWDSIPAAREGVTCIACHRVNEDYGKINGERRIEMGDISQPMYGAGYGQKLAEMIENKSTYKIKTERGEKGPGQEIHTKVIHFDQIADSSFCVSCHQVAVQPGIALEVVWAQYRASPACKEGITCQECHMGREPGVANGYTTAPVAVVNGKDISPERKHSNHMFYGPGYSIAHPGLFPHNSKAEEWSMKEWLEFDYRAGWGTEKFEELVDDKKIKVNFPSTWSNADDRADARELVDENLGKLEEKRHMRHRLMENGSHLEGPIFHKDPVAGRKLQFRYDVTNKNPGHNMPSGSLGAQPQVWLNVALTGPNGQHLWESGYVDRNGDVADVHSLEVAAGRIKRDFQLFNLQTKFLITGVKGTDREMYLPVNTDFDQLPFIRQSSFPVTVMNHPPGIRMEAHSIPPLGTMKAKYSVPADRIRQPGVYKLSVRMRSRAEPIYFMRFCKATPEMERNMNYWMLDYHEQSFRFMVH